MPGKQDWDDRLTALNTLLAELYSTVNDSRRVVAAAGLPATFIKFHDAALINWYNILDEARKRGRIEAIIHVARKDFPNHSGFLEFDQSATTGLSDTGQMPADLKSNSRPIHAEQNSSSPPAARTDQVRSAIVGAHVVILVHGIRDYALWQDSIRSTLEREGLKVEPMNYDRFNLIKFLLPIWFFRRQAIEEVWKQIRIVMHNNPNAPVSIIAHSFGTFVVSHLMKEGFDLRFHRIIFCGSVVPYNFDFEQIQGRFVAPILNEVGTRDVWPALAESITTGYGSAGTYGFRRPLVRDRWHNGAGHGYFLDASFCKKYWVPFLNTGEIVRDPDLPESPRIWLQALSVVKIKYILIVLAIVLAVFSFPNARERLQFGTSTHTTVLRQNLLQIDRPLAWMSSSEGYSAGNKEQWLALLNGIDSSADKVLKGKVEALILLVSNSPDNPGDPFYNIRVSNDARLKLDDLRSYLHKEAVASGIEITKRRN